MQQEFDEIFSGTKISISFKTGAQSVLEIREQDVKEVPLNIEDPEAKILIGSSLPQHIKQELIMFLKDRSKKFS